MDMYIYIYIHMYIYMYIYAYIYIVDETLIALDQGNRGTNKLAQGGHKGLAQWARPTWAGSRGPRGRHKGPEITYIYIYIYMFI